MKQITEDYISFEIAKLLKEKGFDAKCDNCYAYFADDDIRFLNLNYPKSAQSLIKDRYPCVTPQLVLKWLRLCYDIIIDVSPNLTLDDVCKGGFMAEVYQYGHRVPDGEFGCNIGDDYTYEQVVEAALSYVLKNLI